MKLYLPGLRSLHTLINIPCSVFAKPTLCLTHLVAFPLNAQLYDVAMTYCFKTEVITNNKSILTTVESGISAYKYFKL